MKKTFQLHAAGKDDARVVDAIKNEVRKYVKRERNKKLPTGFELWSFNCRVGADEAGAEATQINDLSSAIDKVAAANSPVVYVEIIAVPGHRPTRSSAPELPA